MSKYKACVFGNPIKQSKSPIIHRMFAEQFDIALDYQKRFAEVDEFAHSADDFFSNDIAIGANVTMPFKGDALQYATSLSLQAERAGAVNTLIKSSRGIVGDNTDGYGLLTDLLDNEVKIDDSKILIIGAGGAVKGIIPAMIDANVNHIDILNRSEHKAQELSEYTNQYAKNKTRVIQPETCDADYDVIINGTSLSLTSTLPNLPIKVFESNPSVYDMVYLNEPTVFLKYAEQNGCSKRIDGLGMLVHQAARSFELWFHMKPKTQPVLDYLRKQL